ncbi:PIN domain nuclease [Nocardia coubleae]|uniref:Ribonuclease VapC n=1 Tax=Nocardia coubleae TaxID=356147 RepID=A0A846W5V0_9NOCA|nr:PIN domain nuclease [Nocardia coubleae]NKX87997.1 PIN domain nuclease [Nocardia coubleae]
MISYLVDTSAAVRLIANPALQRAWHETINSGVIAICDVVELELLYSATSLGDRLRKRALFGELFGWAPTPDRVWVRAHEVQQLLTEQGWHRSAGAADLAIAATAEANHLTLLHYDHDYEAVAKVTGQSTRWIAQPGTVS